VLNQRHRVIVWAALALVGIWVVALAGWWLAGSLKVTPEKVRDYVDSVDFSKLSGDARARALQKLADMLNKLSFEERQRLRLGRTMESWFKQMTEEEKAAFIEATMPTGMKQMLTAFEEMPEDKRQRAVDNAIKRLRDERMQSGSKGGPKPGGTNAPPISPELEEKIREIGLKSFYGQSSAQTKAELAPLLEELQNSMQSGAAFRGGRR
jgi:hypothetical protein